MRIAKAEDFALREFRQLQAKYDLMPTEAGENNIVLITSLADKLLLDCILPGKSPLKAPGKIYS